MRVCVVGCGGVGFYCSLILSHYPDIELVLIDRDRSDIVNANRLPLPPFVLFLSRNKCYETIRFIKHVNPNVCANYIDDFINDENIDRYMHDCDVVLDATDSPLVQSLIKNYCVKTRKTLLSVHYDGLHFTIEYLPPNSADNAFDEWNVDNRTGYQTFPSCALTPAIACSIAIKILMERPKRRIVISKHLDELVQPLKR